MIVWGGNITGGGASVFDWQYTNTGARYNPETDTWTPMSVVNAPSPRNTYIGGWNGSEMIIWGGREDWNNWTNTGGVYNLETDTWTSMSVVNTPLGVKGGKFAWTGSELIVWGGITNNDVRTNSGGIYKSTTDSWTSFLSPDEITPLCCGRQTLWTGTEMISWGTPYGIGYRYNPTTNDWFVMALIVALGQRFSHTMVWTGTEMIVWGGVSVGDEIRLNTGAIYTPGENPLQITTDAILSDGKFGQEYSSSIISTGGTPPYSFSIVDGSLPSGLKLNLTTGEINGIPTSVSASNFSIQITDASLPEQTIQKEFQLRILPDKTNLSIQSPSIAFVPQQPDPGQQVTIKADVSNLGFSDADAITVSLYDFDVKIGETTILELEVGQVQQVTFQSVFQTSDLRLLTI